MVWHFIGVCIINRTLHDRLEIRNFTSRVEKYFTRSLRSLVKYFSTLEEKFRISARPCNILYLFFSGKAKEPRERARTFPPVRRRDAQGNFTRVRWSARSQLKIFQSSLFYIGKQSKLKATLRLANTWSCLPTTEGNTSPGQSHSLTFGVRNMVWKCLV